VSNGVLEEPVAIEAEQHLIGSILADGEALAEVRGSISASDFWEPRHAKLYGVLTRIADSGREIVPAAVAAQLEPAEADYAGDLLASVIDGRHAAALARVVAEYSQRRRVLEIARRVGKLACATTNSAALAAVETLAVEILDAKRGAGPRKASTFAAAVLAEVDAAQSASPEDRGIRTGLHDLDRVLGGMRPGTVTVVAARPSQGKSSFSTTLLMRQCVERDVPAALFTVEVTAHDAIRNIACCLARVNGHALMQEGHGSGSGLTDAQFQSFTEALGRTVAAPLWIDDGDMTAASIRASVRRLKMAHGIKVAVVDYLQLLGGDADLGRNASREREVAKMSQQLKLAAKESQVALVVLAQLNREVENRAGGAPRLSDLRESGSIEQDADIVILLHEAQSKDGARQGGSSAHETKTLIVAKNRNGPTASRIDVVLNKPCTRFESIGGAVAAEFADLAGPVSVPKEWSS
jgi:replicative DNA helicase